ncbi:MAG: SDR family oxidoreductase [Patescibacteria group bacterium]|jgi:UDP-glucose 4-epimerase
MKILVTGGAGFIGSHLVDRLVKEGHSVAVVDNLSAGRKQNLNPKAKFYRLNIQSPKLREVFKAVRPQVVFHLAAQMDVRRSVSDPRFDAETNILGTINLLENCRQYKTQKFIFASSGGAIYGDAPRRFIPTKESYPAQPLSPYGISKLTAEYYLEYYREIFGLRYAALRFSNVYGPRQRPDGEAGVVAIFFGQLLKGQPPMIYGTGRQTRDYVFVEDVARALILAMKKKAVGSFNIGTGRETEVNQLFSKIAKIMGIKTEPIAKPERAGEQKWSCLDAGLARRELGWRPKVGLDGGLEKTGKWFGKH